MFPQTKSFSQEFYREHFALRSRLLRQRRSGISVILLVLAIFVILGSAGLAVDYALLVNDKNQWQRACDAAALAGAQELKKTGNDSTDTAAASRIATQVAGQNGVPVSANNISFLDDNTKIRVEASNTRSLFFMRVLGIAQGSVRTAAIAGVTVTPGTTQPKVVPIGVTTTTVEAYTNPLSTQQVALSLPRIVSEPYTINQFLIYDLRSSGASPTQMKNQLLNGWTTEIGSFHRSLDASDGAALPKFEEALADRFERSAQSPWNDTWTGNLETSTGIRYQQIVDGNSPSDNPRVMNLLVNAPAPQSGGITMHEVLSLVPVYIEGWENGRLLVRFLPASVNNSTTGSSRKISLLQ